MELVLEAGAEDVREEENTFEVITDPSDFETVKDAVDKAEISATIAEVTMLPQTYANLEGKQAEQMLRLMDMLDDCDDVQKVHTNADIPDEFL